MDLPYSALRTHSSGRFLCRGDRQFSDVHGCEDNGVHHLNAMGCSPHVPFNPGFAPLADFAERKTGEFGFAKPAPPRLIITVLNVIFLEGGDGLWQW
jgi:hypothetical protein